MHKQNQEQFQLNCKVNAQKPVWQYTRDKIVSTMLSYRTCYAMCKYVFRLAGTLLAFVCVSVCTLAVQYFDCDFRYGQGGHGSDRSDVRF